MLLYPTLAEEGGLNPLQGRFDTDEEHHLDAPVAQRQRQRLQTPFSAGSIPARRTIGSVMQLADMLASEASSYRFESCQAHQSLDSSRVLPDVV